MDARNRVPSRLRRRATSATGGSGAQRHGHGRGVGALDASAVPLVRILAFLPCRRLCWLDLTGSKA